MMPDVSPEAAARRGPRHPGRAAGRTGWGGLGFALAGAVLALEASVASAEPRVLPPREPPALQLVPVRARLAARTAAESAAQGPPADALARLAAAEAADPGNPWFDVERSRVLARLGRPDEAAAAAREALAPEVRDVELLLAAQALDRVDPALGDASFARGLAAYRAAGYRPELARSLVPLVVLLGRPEEAMDADAVVRRADRVAAFAPFVEGAPGFFEAAHRRAASHGSPRAASFATRRDEALAAWSLPWTARNAGALLQLTLASAFACVFAFVAALARARALSAEPGATGLVRWLPTSRFDPATRVSLVLVAALSLGAGMLSARGVATVGLEASAPLGLTSGLPNDDETATFVRRLRGTDGAAVRAYVEALRQGRTPPPLDPNAIPRALEATARAEAGPALSDPVRATSALFALSAGLGQGVVRGPQVGLVVLVLAIAALALFSPGWRSRFVPNGRDAAGRVASALIPFGSSALGPLAAPALAVVLYALFAASMLQSTGGLASNLLDAIATPSLAGFHGVYEPVHGPVERLSRALASALPLLLALHVALEVVRVWRARRATVATPS